MTYNISFHIEQHQFSIPSSFDRRYFFALPMAELDVIVFEISVSRLYFLQKYAFGLFGSVAKDSIRPNIIS